MIALTKTYVEQIHLNKDMYDDMSKVVSLN